ncbi:Gfo/Idh/MocA family protein [Haloarcula sp. GH36]|uniref:Gfo/Idh/MocA family protein n=1 Tax=Haloarcula montana TaxID=3111776 RepID=UPI002D77BD78|nr:Gfo/Idh/MocA family oxidoreductase [Haloarcula sp. GH36]
MYEPNGLSTPIRWGVIGCGDVLERKSGPAFHQSERSCIRAVVSSDGESATRYAAAHDVPVATGDAEQVITDPEIDAVYVASPPNTHEDFTGAAAEAGKPVLVEKPMGRSLTEGRVMIDACDRAGVELFVAYYRRFHPHIEEMQTLLAEGRIGEPVSAIVNHAFPRPNDSGWRETPEISGGGWFVDATSHRVDLLCHLLGAPTEATGVVRCDDGDSRTETAVSLSLAVADGVCCTVTSDFVGAGSTDRFVIRGTAGSIVAETLDSGAFTYEVGGEPEGVACNQPEPTHGGLLDHVEAVLLDGETNRSTGRDAIQTAAILDKCVRSAYADAIPTTLWDGSFPLID